MSLSKSILTALFIVTATSPMAGCAGLAGLAGGGGAGGASILGDLGKFAPPGLGTNLSLSDAEGRGLPYEVRPSNKAQIEADAGKLYGAY